MLCACCVLRHRAWYFTPPAVVRSVTFPGKVGNGGRVPAAAVACRNALDQLSRLTLNRTDEQRDTPLHAPPPAPGLSRSPLYPYPSATLLRGRQRARSSLVDFIANKDGSVLLATVLLSRWSRLHAAQTEQTVPATRQAAKYSVAVFNHLHDDYLAYGYARILSYHLELISECMARRSEVPG